MEVRGFSTIDVYDASAGTPTLSTLQSYDRVLAYTDYAPNNSSALGDVLKSYVDGGGKVVMAAYSMTDPWAISGGIAGTGYDPLVNVGANGYVSGNLVAVVPGNPIFNGINLANVTYFNNGNFAHPDLDSGATLLATDGAGVDMIAENAADDVIGFNFFPSTPPSFTGNDDAFYDLLGNALNDFGPTTSSTVPDQASTGCLLRLSAFAMMAASRKFAANKA